jgi:endonuclease/exonuclease/phosphatase family metal-dependent hydrolase
MTVSVLTYNVLFNKALSNFENLLSICKPDIVCLQEIETHEDNLKFMERHGYQLADFSNSFIKFGRVYGLATFYNPQTLDFIDSLSLNLPRSYYEFFLMLLRGGNNPRTVLKTVFKVKKSSKTITNYNLHLTAWGANGIRVRQIKTTLEDIQATETDPLIIAGDFNYPYQRKQFQSLIEEYHLLEATSNLYTTFEGTWFRFIPMKLKLDYILYKHLTHIKTERLELRDSDHYPIYAEFEL